MEKLQINEEFKSLIPPLTNDEYDLLEQNILKEGIRDPIIVYDNVIIDGHNRFKIAQKHNLKFDIIDKKLRKALVDSVLKSYSVTQENFEYSKKLFSKAWDLQPETVEG